MSNKTNANNTRAKKLLIALMSSLVAVALGVTCALWFDNGSSPVAVDGVGAGDALTSTAYADGTATGNVVSKLKNGDTLTYNYTGSVVSVTIPQGTYTLEVWGAQGGVSSHAPTASNTGGYTKGTYVVSSSSTTLYIAVGGKGTDGNYGYTGGWNGGGDGGKKSSDTGGGGGATHIATRTGTLRDLSSYKGNVLVVAGGGGGNGCSNWIGGKGGGGLTSSTSTGGAGSGGSSYSPGGVGATTSGPGSVRSGGTVGGFGYGGWSRSSSLYGCGGGGGGYYGGSAGANLSGGGASGGGGSGYVNTSYVSGYSGTLGGRTGNGLARITAVNLNQNPTSNNYRVGGSSATYARQTALSVAVTVDQLATDPDSTKTTLYFTNGTAGSLDSFTTTANGNIFLNSACTVAASSYMNWTWNSTRQFTITKILKYPRNGVDYCTQDGRLTLYAKVRDNYGSSASRGWSIVTFYVYVTNNPITPKTGSNFTEVSKTGYTYRYGLPTHTGDANKNLNYLGTPRSIYNPVAGATAQRTVFLPKPIAPTDTTQYTIYAADLFTDSDTAADKVAIKTVTPDSGFTSYNGYYRINYNTDSSYASGTYPSITVTPTGVRPPGAIYVCMTITAQTSETYSKVAIGATNTTFKLVFRIANTRPYYASTADMPSGVSLTEPYVELAPGGTATVNINKMIYDLDDASLSAYFATGAADVKVPTNEYIQVDMSNVKVPLKSNVASNYYNKTEPSTTGTLSSTSGEGILPTGFDKSVLAPTGSAAAANACVTYSFDSNKVIRFTARAATTYMYATDGRKGDFYMMVRVVDPSDVGDTGIWFPIAIKVTSNTPTGTSPATAVNLDFGSSYTPGTVAADARQGAAPYAVLTPISYTSGGTLKGIGAVSKTESLRAEGHATPFATDADSFMYPAVSSGAVEQARPLNDVVMLDYTLGSGTALTDIPVSDFTVLYDTADFFEVKPIELFASKDVFAKLRMTAAQLRTFGVVDAGDNVYSYLGLQIIPKRSTGDKYFQIGIKVKDSHESKSTVTLCVNVANRSVSLRRATADATDATFSTDYPINLAGTVGKYVDNKSIGQSAVNYTIECNDVIQITPYDFVYDLDIDFDHSKLNITGAGAETVFNTNPANAKFGEASSFINREYSIPNTLSPSELASAPTAVKRQSLYFANTANIISNAEQYASYVGVTVSDSCTTGSGSFPVPCIRVVGKSRTTSAIVQIRFTVTDGFSSVDCMFTVTVLNAAPVLNTEENHPVTGSDTVRIKAPYSMSVSKMPTSYEFTASALAYDKDGDTPTFKSGTAKVVAKDGDEYYSYLGKFGDTYGGLTYDIGSGKYKRGEADYTGEVFDLSDYVYCNITKNAGGVDVVYIEALSSTQLFDKQIYMSVIVQDGFRAQPQEARLYLLIHVENSKPTFVPDQISASGTVTSKEYTWQISYEDSSELKMSRYIFNSKELYDANDLTNASGQIISVPPANKVWLFNDADEQQHTMLDPVLWKPTGSTNYVDSLVKKGGTTTSNGTVVPTLITESMFASETASEGLEGGNSAAVIYSPMYIRETSVEKQYLKLSLLFFKKNADGTFSALAPTDAAIVDAKYWALVITDDTGSTMSPDKMQIAIALRDDHNDRKVYNADKTAFETGSTGFHVLNLYYTYKSPGLTAMHSYYRTDPVVESRTLLDASDESKGYQLDYNGINANGTATYMFEGSVPTNQTELQSATFKDDFKYQYFLKTVFTQKGSVVEARGTYKCYPNVSTDAFYYKPIEVGGDSVNSKTLVPISYIAMPKGITTTTEGNTHVTFANATAKPKESTGVVWTAEERAKYKLNESDFLSWGSPENIGYVLDNLTLTDGLGGTWSGSDINSNPYIDIGYTADAKEINSEKYVNHKRFNLEQNGTTYSLKAIADRDSTTGASIYREDKFGLSFEKKKYSADNPEWGKRKTGTLKLTVALKTNSYVTGLSESAVEYVDVEIVLKNTAPELAYSQSGSPLTFKGFTDQGFVKMTTSDTAGKTVVLNDAKVESGKHTGDFKFIYNDVDTSDTVKFYMPSAFGRLTEKEVALGAGANATWTSTAQKEYYDSETMTLEEKMKYVPNPGYEKFFTVSPSDGSASTLQIVPVAKTQLNIPTAHTADQIASLLDRYHLKKDDSGKIYYPFRVIVYDEVNGSPFADGYWSVLIIKVYIDNDPIKVNTAMVPNKFTAESPYKNVPVYDFRLTTGSDFFVDVSSLLVDNDMLGVGTSFALKPDWDTRGDEEHLKNDYLVMPAPTDFDRVDNKGNKISDPLPIDVSSPKADSGLTGTTIIFRANNAFKQTVNMVYTFSDCTGELTGKAGSSVRLMFTVSYNNENPTANAETFGGADSLTISMRTGDSFSVYASDGSKFDGDVKGGFSSWTGKTSGYIKPGEYDVEVPADKKGEFDSLAAMRRAEFKLYADAAEYDEDNETGKAGYLGGLVLASDDAPSTLRIDRTSYAKPGDGSAFSVERVYAARREDTTASLPLVQKFTALSVINTTITFTVVDGSGKTVDINITVNVMTSPPRAATAEDVAAGTVTLPTRFQDKVDPSNPDAPKLELTETPNLFKTKLSYGDIVELELDRFIVDDDAGDSANLSIFRQANNTYFDIVNDTGISVVQAERDWVFPDTKTGSLLRLQAIDFINTEDQKTTVTFRVTDMHGAVSEPISIEIEIEPNNLTSGSTAAAPYNFAVKSFAQYLDEGEEKVELEIVSPTAPSDKNKVVFYDPDVNAPSSEYYVSVYALLKKESNGSFSAINKPSDFEENKDKYCILTLEDSLTDDYDTDVAKYVARFFKIGISIDGKTLTFIPNSATISASASAKKLSEIPLLVVAGKRYTSSAGPTLEKKEANLSVSVANSGVVAVGSLPTNFGYPQIPVTVPGDGESEPKTEKHPREAEFLEFTGTAGDSLTWDLYNLEDKELGLFYDYDLINNPAVVSESGQNTGGLETITFATHKFSGITEAVTGKGDVLSVNRSPDGKQITIKINRKVFTGQPAKDGNEKSYTDVDVDIYVADTMGSRAGITDMRNLVKTTIKVHVENDQPEFKKMEKGAVTGSPAFGIEWSVMEGYYLNAALETKLPDDATAKRAHSITLNIDEIIEDADIAMDEYVMVDAGSDNSLMRKDGTMTGSVTSDGRNDGIGRLKLGTETLFEVTLSTGTNEYSVSTLKRITFTCVSTRRGATASCQIMLRDSVKGSTTSILTVTLTVDNIAPSLKQGAVTDITIMGVGDKKTEADEKAAAVSFNIVDFLADVNGDVFLGSEKGERAPTYVFIDELNVYKKGGLIKEPEIRGPYADKIWQEGGSATLQACTVAWDETDSFHQTFLITPLRGVYGRQTVTFTIVDSGFSEGADTGILDGKTYALDINITIANPLDNVPDTLAEVKIGAGITRTFTVGDLLGDEAEGYDIKKIEETSSNYFKVLKPGDVQTGVITSAVNNVVPSTENWRITASSAPGTTANMTVTFTAGGVDLKRTLPVTVIANSEPLYKSGKTKYEYTTQVLTDPTARTLKIRPTDWFEDADEEDIMTFVAPVESSQTVKVEAVLDYDLDGSEYILLKFNGRGEADITFNVMDLSGTLYQKTITVNCTNAPELGWWDNLLSLIEANQMWFWIIVGSVLLFLILLIILIIVIHKRRKMRREIEMLLNSEIELEEEMMRLSAGGSAPYQSFGYLPPTQQTVNNPGFMLGGGAQNPPPNTMQLNAGSGANPGANNVPPQTVTVQQPTMSQPGPVPPTQAAPGYAPPQNNDGFDPDNF